MDIERLFNVVLNASHDGILILDNKGTIIYINEAISRLVGCDLSELLGQNVNVLVEKHIIPKRSISFEALQKKRKTTDLLKIRGQKILVTATPCMKDQNSVEYVITNVRNLGELDTMATMFLESSLKWDSPIINCNHSMLQKKVIREKIQALEFPDFNFESDAMTEICEIALRTAPIDISILLMGETGVGKGLLAQIIHKASFRRNLPMVEIDCSGFPEGLIDSELFGYTEGTFTGARKMGKTGLIEAANNSTLFLDEIGTMPLEFQTRLLKFLDDGYILPLGSTERKWVNVRVIASTNYVLSEQVAKGKFRKDLFYRLSVLPIVIPPLRQRREDINVLIETFLQKYRMKYQKSINIDQEVKRNLLYYDYPGNVRELNNVIERLALLTKDDIVISKEGLPPYMIQPNLHKNAISDLFVNNRSLKALIINYEKQIIKRLMDKYKSTYKVANILGVSQPTIVRKIHRYKDTVNVKTKEHKEG